MHKNLIFLLVCLLLSCRKPANIALQLDSPIPVISCFYTINKPFLLQIGYTYNGGESPKWESAATVELFENDVSKGIFTYTDSGKYALNYFPITENKYKIAINIPNYEKIWAEDILPNPPVIADAYYTLGKSYIQIGSESGPAFDFYAEIKNTNAANDFYEEYLKSQFMADGYWQDAAPFYWYKSMIDNPILLAEGDLEYYNALGVSGLVFSDKLFNNKTTEFLVKSLYYNDLQSYKPENHRYYVRLNAVSQNYYFYKKSWLIHAFNQASSVEIQSDFFSFIQLGEPVELYSNMKGGKALGIFAGYNMSQKQYTYVP